ncbi:hypothetical protein [Streptacidiphilus melanogenes]|uniref:hypothetical protein n=1 Tax=Streptacidiphilus melanogenes TaxID=411235 RepID=UPI0007C6D4B6|nr:hypothetical protein [Streptacidiphilus melanogenes]
MEDAFTLLRRAVELLPDDPGAEHAWTAGDVRAGIEFQEWGTALDVLAVIGEACPVPAVFWEMLAEAARQLMLERTRRWCEWLGWEAQHGTVRARLTLAGAEEGRRRTAFAGDGQLRPLWDIGGRTPDGRPDLRVARLWVESAPTLGPGETAEVRLAPLRPEHWRQLRPGEVVTMYEARPVGGVAEILEVRSPRVRTALKHGGAPDLGRSGAPRCCSGDACHSPGT